MAKSKKKTKSAATRKSERHGYESQKKWKPLYSKEKLKAQQEEMSEKLKKASKPPVAKKVYVQPVRHADGRYVKGCISPNASGRPLNGTTQLSHLLAAVRRVESRENKNLLEHFVSRAFVTDKVLIAVMKKLIPDLQSIAVSPNFNEEMTDAVAQDIQKKLAERYGSTRDQEHSETLPILESAPAEVENPN